MKRLILIGLNYHGIFLISYWNLSLSFPTICPNTALVSFAYPFPQDNLRSTDGKDQNPLAGPRRLLPRKGGSVRRREAFPEVQIPATELIALSTGPG